MCQNGIFTGTFEQFGTDIRLTMGIMNGGLQYFWVACPSFLMNYA